MSEEEYVSVITDREELYDKCENMEQLYDKYYLPLLDIHFRKTYKLQQENKQLKEEKRKVRDYINKHCVNEKISKEVGYKCYTMADTNELEKIMKILEDKDVEE